MTLSENLLLAYARYFPIRKGKYRLVERFGTQIAKRDPIRRAHLIYGDYRMDCDLRMMLQRQFYFFGTYFLEQSVIERWCQFAKTSRIVFDIGANAGIYSLAARASNSSATIHAFEPTPSIAQHFDDTLALNGLTQQITVHRMAVATETGTAFLNLFGAERFGNEGMNFVTLDQQEGESIGVPTVSVDDFCDEHAIDTIDLMKIDVQGNEPAVLEGAMKKIQEGKLNVVFFELNWNRTDRSKCSATRAISHLADAGYRFADASSRSLDFQPPGDWMHRLSDVVAIAPVATRQDSSHSPALHSSSQNARH